MKKYFLTLFLMFISFIGFSQTPNFQTDSVNIRKMYSMSLLEGKSYQWLEHLSNNIGARISGSIGAEKAVRFTKSELDKLGLDRVYLQPVMVPKWTRGFPEYAYMQSAGSTTTMNVAALGGSVATPDVGIRAEVVEVQEMSDLEKLGKENIQGKIVFFNKAMPPEIINTFEAYGQTVGQRYNAAAQAVKYGALAVLVRSLSLKIDEVPHTGSMSYGDLPDNKKIPAAALSTKDANYLSTVLKLNKNIKFYLKMNCRSYPDVQSYNVIGEIKGSEFPKEIIVVGGHLDSWDIGDGAHDDGAGVVQAMEVLRMFQKLEIKPKRTLRVVLFMNEENGLRGGKKYAATAKEKNENHLFALESDAGGFTPRGFSFGADDNQFNKILSWKKLFEPYDIHFFARAGGGADVNTLKSGKTVVAELIPDSQRYFDIHHSKSDTFDKVNKRELELGAASMAALIYLVDQHGF